MEHGYTIFVKTHLNLLKNGAAGNIENNPRFKKRKLWSISAVIKHI